jgi:lipopolysaccharide transport system ATP-binding protein
MRESLVVQDLGKHYTLSHKRQVGSFKELLNSLPRALARKEEQSDAEQEFWALRNINFSVAAGECVGILGRNGSGKSTLLKVLARVIPPSTGRVGVRGRMAALLEVGTGFHPELSGRENIFLNGAILGLPRKTVVDSFDAIVDYAGVEQFLDTPVKHYSSGMYVRLAFAIAAHVRPDVLIVDEVLAVGDAAFQEKCLKSMKELVANGSSLLFVTHDYDFYTRLCDRVLWLEKGHSREMTDDVAGALARFKTEILKD